MASDDAYKIDGATGRRLDKTIRVVLGSGSSSGGSPLDATKSGETCWGKLGTKVADGFEWKEQFRKIGSDDKPTWVDVANGRKGDNTKDDDAKNLAVELLKGSAPASGATVLLRRAVILAKKASDSDPDKWLVRWVIVAPLSFIQHGKLTAAWSPGSNTVTLQPVTGPLSGTATSDDPITAYISYPLGKGAVSFAADVNDVLGYTVIGTSGADPIYMLHNAPQMPRASKQYQVISNEANSGTNWQAAYTAAHDG
jgi:hypothetical protein